MGAEFSARYYKGKLTRKEVREKFAVDVKQCLYDNGHSYSGGIGMLGGIGKWRKGFSDEDEACEYIEDNHDKWEEAIAAFWENENGCGWVVGGWCSS